MKVDWSDGRWGALIPYTCDDRGFTHFVSFTAPISLNRSTAITETVIEWSNHMDLPTRNSYDLFHKHREVRNRLWKALRAKGFRVVRLKIRPL